MRPVSGEIMMPGASTAPAGRPREADLVDAEFETVDAARTARTAVAPRGPQLGAPPPAGLALLVPDKARTDGAAGARGRLFWGAGIVLVIGAFWIAGGHSLARNLTALRTAAPVFRIVELQSRLERDGGRAVLVVDGAALNAGLRAGALPGLAIDVLAPDGSTTRYVLGTNARRLDPGDRFGFSGRLVVPRDGVKSVSVSFTSL